MTVRTAEIVMAVLMALMSLAIMIKSMDGLQIGWVPQKGPGSGAWPFWLATGMLLTCLWTIVRWFRGTTPESRSREPFIGSTEARIVGVTVAALFLLMLGSQFIGMYIAILLFLFFYLKVLGAHSWLLSVSLSLLTPTALFFFFEGALRIPLPKGMSEPLFYPLYDLIY